MTSTVTGEIESEKTSNSQINTLREETQSQEKAGALNEVHN